MACLSKKRWERSAQTVSGSLPFPVHPPRCPLHGCVCCSLLIMNIWQNWNRADSSGARFPPSGQVILLGVLWWQLIHQYILFFYEECCAHRPCDSDNTIFNSFNPKCAKWARLFTSWGVFCLPCTGRYVILCKLGKEVGSRNTDCKSNPSCLSLCNRK